MIDPTQDQKTGNAAIEQTVAGTIGAFVRFTRCPNVKCRQAELIVRIGQATFRGGDYRLSDENPTVRRLLPVSSARPLPEYVPSAIRADYEEACEIASLSPKASATLARRALQGMIRDFWGIVRPRLVDEIKELQQEVSRDTWEAMDAVRKVGNIGAHMEADIGVIVDVDPGEAELLIGLLETLIDDWYVVRHEREERNAAILKMAAAKEALRAARQAKLAEAETTPVPPPTPPAPSACA